MAIQPLPEVVTAAQLAELLGVTDRQIQYWHKQAGLPKAGRNQYPLKGCILWFATQHTPAAGGPGDKTKDEQQQELLYEQTIKTRLDNRKRQGELLEATAVREVINSAVVQLGALLDAFAPRMAGILSSVTDPGEVQKIVFSECRQIRREYTRSLRDIAGDIEGSG